MLFGHKAVETGAACLLLMVQGQIAEATLGHLAIASETGILTVFPILGLTWTRHARHLTNRWMSAAFVAVCAFFADAIVHRSHFGGEYTEAAWTAVGAFVLSVAVSYTPVGKQIDRLAETFLEP
jgi:integral membrane sensor domain MASE1